MKIVFFGTPDYVVPVVDHLYKVFKISHESPIVAVVTQPPKPVGRKHFLEYSPVDTWAHKKKVPIFFDANKITKENLKADLGILASYGAIIPQEVINHFPYGIVNIHPSLLPKWRGASPVQATLISSDKEAGVSIIKIDKLLDHGPIISQFTEKILPDDTTVSLRSRLFERSGNVLVTLLPAYIGGKITPREQDHKKATFTREIKKEDAFVEPIALNAVLEGRNYKKKWEIKFMKDFTISYSSTTIDKFIRAMQPWPCAWTQIKILGDKDTKILRLKILKAHLGESQVTSHKLQVTKLVLDEVQLEGKNPITWKQFKEGYPNFKFS